MPRVMRTAVRIPAQVKKTASRTSGRSKRLKVSDKTPTDTNKNNLVTLTSDGVKNEQIDYCSGPHPLLIPMLVSIIITFLNPDLQSLKQLRLVCSTWYEASLHLWRRKLAVLTIGPDASAFTQPESKGLQFTTFLQIYQDPLSIHRFFQRPFSKYKLVNFTIDIKVCDGQYQNQQAKILWDIIGPLMEYIHFEKCTFLGTVNQPLHQLLIRKIPNLRYLALTKVTLKQAPPEIIPSDLFKEDSHPTLKSLTVYEEVHMEFAQLIGLPLKSAVLNLLPFPHPRSVYRQLPTVLGAVSNNDLFFKSVSGSLETLEIFLPPFTIQNSAISLTATSMQFLRELHLLGTVCHNFDFLRFTPVLEKLCVDLGCYGKREEIKKMVEGSRGTDGHFLFQYKAKREDHMTKYLSHWIGMDDFQVESLAHLEIDYEYNEKGLRLLGNMMPRLRFLKTVLSDKIVGVVGETWGDSLVELVCDFGSKVENKMFFGEEFRHLRSKEKKNISDLKKLERFQFDALCGKSKLTDAAVYKGLLKMSSLKFVQICVGSKMSGKAEQDLKNKIEDCRVIRNYSLEDGGNHGNYECCSRQTFLEQVQVNFRQVGNN